MSDRLSADGLGVSRETYDVLSDYAELLTAENQVQNLIAKSTVSDLWIRHIADASQLVALADHKGSWVDIGSGAGLPGIVIAIVTGSPVTLVEPRRLRANFLHRTAAALELNNVSVVQAKAEAIDGRFDFITARAVASIDRLFGMTARFSHATTTWLLPKGRSAQSELDEARKSWQGAFKLVASRTDPDAKILIASGVRRIAGK